MREILAEARHQSAQLWMSVINYGEVIYTIERKRGRGTAMDIVKAINQLPIALVEADQSLALAAAHIKATRRLSCADAFAVALAQEKKAPILTGDPEFKAVESLVQIEWLPQKGET